MTDDIIKKAYLDSNILIALFLKKDVDEKTKIDKSKIVRILFRDFKKNKKFKLCISNWCLIETFKVLTNRKRAHVEKVYEWINDIYSTHKIGGVEVEILRFVSDYSVEDLFSDIKHNSKDFSKLPLADNLHVIAMKKRKVRHIITFDLNDFKPIPIVIQVDPVELAKQISSPGLGKFVLGKSKLG